MLKDKNTPSADKLEWINTLQGTRTNILKLLVEGPEYLRTAKQVYPPKDCKTSLSSYDTITDSS
jgi:hypothetical protein